MIKIIEQDKVDYSISYKINNGLKLNKENKKYLDKIFNPRIAYNLAKNKCELYELKDYEKECIKISYWAYRFARFIPGANIEICQEAACKEPEGAYLFAKHIKNADIKKCQEAACKKPSFAYLFAKNIPKANIERCQEAACKDPESAYYFALKIKGANIEKCQKEAFKVDWFAYLFSRNIKLI